MKKLSKREKILLALLIVIIVVVSWYKLIYEPVNNRIKEYESSRNVEQTELTVLLPKIRLKREMKDAVEIIKKDPSSIRIPVYDNSKELMVALNKIMTSANSYKIDFGEADKDDYIFLHKINIVFYTNTYKQARKIVDRLATETFVNQISDITYTDETTFTSVLNAKGDLIQKRNDSTKVALTITFFEVDS